MSCGDNVVGSDEGASAQLVVKVDERLPRHVTLLTVEDLRTLLERASGAAAVVAAALVKQRRVERGEAWGRTAVVKVLSQKVV